MSITVQNIYDTICFDLLEDGGLVLGIVTLQQFYDLLNLTILDFCKRSGLFQRIYTQDVIQSQGVYSIPDDLMEIRSVWLAGRWLPPATQRQLNDAIRNWRTITDIPRFYYTDGIGLSSLGLAPAPNYTGASIVGGYQYDSFSASCNPGPVTLNPAQHRDLTVVATRKPTTQVSALTDPIPLIPDDFASQALPFGVLERIFSGDNELKDEQASLFCGAQFTEAINVGVAISGEPEAVE